MVSQGRVLSPRLNRLAKSKRLATRNIFAANAFSHRLLVRNSRNPTVDCAREVSIMHSIIYLVGLVVVVLFVLSLIGLH
jgi:hypothetical protein